MLESAQQPLSLHHLLLMAISAELALESWGRTLEAGTLACWPMGRRWGYGANAARGRAKRQLSHRRAHWMTLSYRWPVLWCAPAWTDLDSLRSVSCTYSTTLSTEVWETKRLRPTRTAPVQILDKLYDFCDISRCGLHCLTYITVKSDLSLQILSLALFLI